MEESAESEPTESEQPADVVLPTPSVASSVLPTPETEEPASQAPSEPLEATFADITIGGPAPSILPPSPPAPILPAPTPPTPPAPQSAVPSVEAAIQSTASRVVSAGAGSSSSDAGPIEDIVLRGAGGEAHAAGSTSLAATLEIVEQAGSIDDLQALLGQECVRALAVGIHGEAVARCVQYVGGLARPEERVLCGWPVLSINEWGSQQIRTLVLSSHALYRVAFSHQKGAIGHYSRTSLGSIQAIERGRFAFKVLLTEPDGRENPVSYFWSAYVKKDAKDTRYERVYYPVHPETVPVELALGIIISSVSVANKLLCRAVGSYCYVTEVVVRDYVPNPNAVDELMDKLVPQLKAVGDRVSSSLKNVFPPQPASARSSRGEG